MRLLAGFTAIILLLATIAFASVAIPNTGCPESTASLGSITLTGNCSITTATTWENGTITITGDIVVNEPLTLRDVTIIFDPSSDFQYTLVLWADFDMDGGGIESTNSFHWDAWAAFDPVITIRNGSFDRGTLDISGGTALVENNVFANVDLFNAFDQTGMRVGSNSTVRWNLFDDYWLYGGAGIVMYDQWGNTKIWGNELRLRCFGLNCMGIENYGIHDGIIPIKPGFPTIEIAWNNITWLEIASGTNSASYDNEYSKRLYIHNNTQTNLAANPVTSPLEMGGVIDSILENNTVNGPSIYGVYQYIYSNAGSIIQYNTFDNVQYGGILQSGYNTYRHNTYTNVANAGQWFCPNSPCAGSSAITAGNQFYNNSYSFKTPSPSSGIVRGDLSNYLDQSFLVHGSVNYWNHGTYSGDSLFWADQTISQMKWENLGSFRRTSMTFGGTTIWDDMPGAGTNGVLTVNGAISQTGSLDPSATFLGAMDRDFTSVTVDATGTVTFTVDSFFADTQYNVSMDGAPATTFTTDAGGYGSFDLNFASQHLIEIEGVGEAPPPPPPPSDAIADLIVIDSGTYYALLQWTAPDNATMYDVRFSIAIIDDGNFDSAMPLAVGLPDPGTLQYLNVTGLVAGTQYWFAIKWYDGASWSSISNVLLVATEP